MVAQGEKGIVYFVGAGPGDPELITVRGQRLLKEAGMVLYAGSLVNPALLEYVQEGVPCYDTSGLVLEEILALMRKGVADEKTVVRLHTGDPSLYGAIQEQIDALAEEGVPFEVIPGVSSFLAAAATLKRELTVPGGTQTVILTRQAGRTPVPPREYLWELGQHRATLCLFLSVHLLDRAVKELLLCYPPETPAAIVERVSWPGERVIRTILKDLPARAREECITRTALVFIGEFLNARGNRSFLYDSSFSHSFRKGSGPCTGVSCSEDRAGKG